MESLIFSKPIPTKLYVLKSCLPPTLSLPRLNFAAARGRSGSCLHSSSASQTTTWKFDDANTHPHFFTQLIQIISNRPKVITVTPSAIVLLSAFCLLFIHPLSAFATSFQTAAKSGGGGLLVHAEILNGAWTGFLAGCLHTLSGPDHLAALAPLSIGRTRMESAAVGALWGCGHDAGQLLFGLLFLLLKDRLSLHIGLLQTWGTRVVGFTLLVIGAMGIREAYENENGEFDVSLQGGFETAAAAIGKKSKVGFATFALHHTTVLCLPSTHHSALKYTTNCPNQTFYLSLSLLPFFSAFNQGKNSPRACNLSLSLSLSLSLFYFTQFLVIGAILNWQNKSVGKGVGESDIFEA